MSPGPSAPVPAGFSFSPVGSGAPLLGFVGQPFVTFPKTGLQISLGIGLVGRTDTTTPQLLIDAIYSAPVETVCFFIPGAIAALTPIIKWHNTRPGGSSGIYNVQADYLTAPTTADALNYFALQLVDTPGTGIVTLPLSGAGVKHFDLDTGPNVPVVQITRAAATTAELGTLGALKGHASQYIPAADVYVSGAEYSGYIHDTRQPSGTAQGGTLTVTILDAAYNVLATLDMTLGATKYQVGGISKSFPVPITLKSGLTYYIGYDIFKTAGLVNFCTDPFNGAATGPGLLGAAPMNGRIRDDLSSPPFTNAATMAQVINPSGFWARAWQVGRFSGTGGNSDEGFFGNAAGTLGLANGLLGRGGGTIMQGDVTASIIAVGAPVATAAGSNLNARVLFSVP